MRALTLLGLFALSNAADWAVIVAGSRTYANYRHQADACHAYQLLVKSGKMDADKVILMMYDDIANNPSNPFPGKIFNKPTNAGEPGVDVYEGCKIDYKGNDVTAANWISVLTGDHAAMAGKGNGRVLNSTSEDRVFINFVDHGGVGIIAFPVGPMLGVRDLNNALLKMYDKKMFAKLVFYMEACESGSMFENILPTGKNIYVTTAANAKESSWGTYCPPQDTINGVHIKSCLGDLYSVNWMESIEAEGRTQSLATHYQTIKTKTTKSHVMQYGDLNFTQEAVGDYIGNGHGLEATHDMTNTAEGVVSSRDIPLHLAYYDYITTDPTDARALLRAGEALQKEVDSRLAADRLFTTFASEVVGASTSMLSARPSASMVVECGTCCDALHQAVQDHCGGYTDYSLKYSYLIPNMCNQVGADAVATHKMVTLLAEMCQKAAL